MFLELLVWVVHDVQFLTPSLTLNRQMTSLDRATGAATGRAAVDAQFERAARQPNSFKIVKVINKDTRRIVRALNRDDMR